jgi:hypothetical protein
MGFCKTPIAMAVAIDIDTPYHLPEGRSKRSRDDAEIDTTSSTCQYDENYAGRKQQRRLHKRVRFATAADSNTTNNNNNEQVLLSELVHSDLDKTKLWWSRKERNGMNEASRKMAKVFRKNHSDQVKHYLRVFDQCSQYPPSQSSSDYLETATIVVPTKVRGLEWGIVPKIKAHRRTHVHEVLQIQDQIKGRLSSEMRYKVLSTRAMRSSRPSRVMARLIGEGDAAILLLPEVIPKAKPPAVRPRMLLPLQR